MVGPKPLPSTFLRVNSPMVETKSPTFALLQTKE